MNDDDDETTVIGRLGAEQIGRWVRIQRGPERSSSRPWVLQGVLREAVHHQDGDDNKTRVVVDFDGAEISLTVDSDAQVTLVNS